MLNHIRTRSAVFITALALLGVSLQAQEDNTFCWMRSYSRGVGGIGTSCPSGTQKDADGLCYPVCGSNYTGVGPVCWENCPSGFTDVGISCQKPGPISYAGYPWKIGDPPFNYGPAGARCRAANPQGCYQSGLVWYPYCPANYHNVGALVCSPNCPSDMTDTGADCVKNTTTRGVGSVPSCGSGMDSDAGLCYPSCTGGYSGVGPMCWSTCPSDHPYQCGAACALNEAACAQAVGDMVIDTASVALNVLSFVYGGPGVTTAIKDAAEAGRGAMADVVAHTAEDGESTLMNGVKEYALAFGKQFIKTQKANGKDPANEFFTAMKRLKTYSLHTLNKATNEFGAGGETSTFNLNDLTALDPTGISSMVMSFTKYGPCNQDEDFTTSAAGDEIQVQPSGTVNITLTAKNPVTITRVTSPAMVGCSITPTADCIGKALTPGQTCNISAAVSSSGPLLGELRIYTSDYTSIPYPIQIAGPPKSGPNCQADPYTDEAVNLTSVTGTWAFDDVQASKLVVQTNGQLTTPTGTGTVSVYGLAGRAFQLKAGSVTTILTLDETGDHLTGAPFPGEIAIKGSGLVLDITGASTADGAVLEQWTATGAMNQLFNFQPQSDGTWAIGIGTINKVLEVEDAATPDGQGNVVQKTPTGGPRQKFRIEPVGDERNGYYRIISVYNGLVLSVLGNSNQAGAQIVQAPWNELSNQEFELSVSSRAVRRPTGPGCPNGEVLFDGLCYDVPPGSTMTTPGIMGKVCPDDWRDDGTSCWPPWNGVAVSAQADPNGSYTLRHPIVVTSCSSYAAANNQSCPANFTNVGGVGSCSCQAQPTLKNITTINGTVPSN